jgi:hypothetical protein
MKEEKNNPKEPNTKTVETTKQKDAGRENIDPLEKETVNEKAKRENWTDVAESHLGIDE